MFFVKIPIINSKGKYNVSLINRLNMEGIKLNITAIFTKEQIDFFFKNINKKSKRRNYTLYFFW